MFLGHMLKIPLIKINVKKLNKLTQFSYIISTKKVFFFFFFVISTSNKIFNMCFNDTNDHLCFLICESDL